MNNQGGRPCIVCNHLQRQEIEADILAGVTTGKISRKYGISKMAISRHRVNHMGLGIQEEDQKDPPVSVNVITGTLTEEDIENRRDPFNGADISALLKLDPGKEEKEKDDDINKRLAEADRQLINDFTPNIHHSRQWPTPIRKREHYK